MTNKKRPVLKSGIYYHLYQRSFNKDDIFLSAADAILFITIFRKYSLLYNINTLAFCLMDNHIHALCKADKADRLSDFVRDSTSVYVREYNKYHKRKGKMFQVPFGCAPKKGSKSVRTCITYINNNPVEAKKVDYMEDYVWNLFAYARTSYPFSKKLILKTASYHLRRAIAEIKAYSDKHAIISPVLWNNLHERLTKEETKQLRDYLLKSYSPVDYNQIAAIFGSISDAISAMHSFMGSEYEIKTDDVRPR